MVSKGGIPFIEVDGLPVAKRGMPGSPHVVIIEPDWQVSDDGQTNAMKKTL
jgi:hypothetical protein